MGHSGASGGLFDGRVARLLDSAKIANDNATQTTHIMF